MSLLTAENVVKDVEARKVKAGTSEERTIYDIVDKDDVKWTAWERPLAEKAYELKGQVSIWKVAIDQKGTYTNRTLKEIESKPASGFQPAMAALEAQVAGNGTAGFDPSVSRGFGETNTTTTAGFPSVPPGVVEEPSFKDRNVWRQCASKAAARMSTTPDEFWKNCDDLVRYYETGERPYQVGDVARQLAAETQTIPAGPPADDDIPF